MRRSLNKSRSVSPGADGLSGPSGPGGPPRSDEAHVLLGPVCPPGPLSMSTSSPDGLLDLSCLSDMNMITCTTYIYLEISNTGVLLNPLRL